MKDRIDAILQRRQAEYLEALIPARDALLERIEELAAVEGHPIADPEVAQVMRILVRLRRPARILEIGTNVGYSVIVMGRECDESAVIETIEIDRETLAVARRFVAEAGLAPRVIFHEGAALDVLPRLDGAFDLVFIDCVKTEYGDYLDHIMPKLRDGALIVADNVLWKGQVAEGARAERERASTGAIAAFNARITSDPRLLTTILPVSDGLSVSVYSA